MKTKNIVNLKFAVKTDFALNLNSLALQNNNVVILISKSSSHKESNYKFHLFVIHNLLIGSNHFQPLEPLT